MKRIVQDLKGYAEGSVVKGIYTVLLNSNFQMIFWYRLAHSLGKLRLHVLSKIIMYLHKLIFAVDIDYRCEIGGGFRIVHGMGIVIGKDVVIGENVAVYKGVVLGGSEDRQREIDGRVCMQPIIGDGTKLYTDAAVFGPCKIGRNCVIGAHAVVTRDIPDNTKVYSRIELRQIPMES